MGPPFLSWGPSITPFWRRTKPYSGAKGIAWIHEWRGTCNLPGVFCASLFRRPYEDRHGRGCDFYFCFFGVVVFRRHLFISQKAAQGAGNQTCRGGEVGDRLAGCWLRFGWVLSSRAVVAAASYTFW